MKRFTLYMLMAFMTLAVGCSEAFDDSAIWDKMSSLEGRIAALEQLCSQMNTNITSLQTVVTALQDNDYVISIVPIQKEVNTIGYVITFSKSGSITIYSGNSGVDGYIPNIGVMKDSNNCYYWTIDGNWLLNDSGKKIEVDADGADGVIPKLKIENDYWYVSFDNGYTWTELGKVSSGDNSGSDNFVINANIANVAYDDDNVYITTDNGTQLVIPRNDNSNKIYYTTTNGKIIKPGQNGLYTTSIVSNVYENGQGIITFAGDFSVIEKYAFNECDNLLSVIIPEGVVEIEEDAFSDCDNLTSVTLPKSIKKISCSAFCESPITAYYGEYASSDNRCIIIDGKLTLFAAEGLTSSYTIPNGVTTIGEDVFRGCTLTNIILPDGLTTIDKYAFAGCVITSITIPDSVTSIGIQAFRNCDSLTSFYGKYASSDHRCLIIDGVLNSFAPAGLTSYIIPSSVASIGESAFLYNNSLKSVTIPNSVTSIEKYAFSHCESLTSITIPNSVTSIRDWAFLNCYSLTSVYCKPATPPTLEYGYVFEGNTYDRKIYVPTTSVNAYKNAEYWSKYADAIVGYNFN